MKKQFCIRILVAILCLVLALAVFTACDTSGGSDETSGSESTGGETSGEAKNTLTVTVANTTIMTSATADENVNAAALILLEAVKQYTGADIAFKTDSEAANANACEILIGSTSREESASVLSELNGQNGYVVKVVGNKIVINATSTAMLDDAVNYFVNNYVSSGANGAFEVANDLCYAYGATGGFSLLDAENKSQYTIVYSQDVDTETNTRTSNGKVIDYVNKGLDYVYQYILLIWEDLSDEVGTTVMVDVDYGAAKDENLEILIGRTNRPETATFLGTCAPNEYGYAVIGNKLVISGWSDLTIGYAAELFLANLDQYIVDDGGVKNIVIPEGESVTASYDKWISDIPLPKDAELNGAVELINNAYEIYYVNTTAEAWKAYRKDIEAAGFSLWQENQIGDNLYATYYSSKTMLHTYHLAYNNTVRVIVESMKTAILPQNEDPNMGEKVAETSFTMYDFDEGVGNWGNCFIITLEDGSFILHDGGANAKYNGKLHEREELYKLLKSMNKREDGRIVIAAWIISHQHYDHFATLYDTVSAYYGEDKNEITVEKMIYNVAEYSVRWNSNNPNNYYEEGKFDNISMWTGAEQVVMHSGQTIQIRNLKLEVLYTVEDIYPEHVITFNNTGLTHRFTVGEGENAQTMAILGDIELKAAEIMVNMYGDALKCDIMQVAHHGSGGSVALYKAFSPTIVVWPNGQAAVNSALSNPNSSNQWHIIDQSLMNQKNVKLLVVADDGHKTIMLPLLGITNNESANEDLVIVTPRTDGRP